jgi:predicted esterase YcpF (UPF0227 family)
MTTLVYLHGFLSSPLSQKAMQTANWLAQNYPEWTFVCPALSSYPTDARKQLEELYATSPKPTFIIGSSLGGFWATWCVEQFGGKAVLVNPAVTPQLRIREFIGKPLKSYYGEQTYTLRMSDLSVLEECDSTELKNPNAYAVMLQTGDETLDYRLALDRYHDSEILLERGGNHSFEGYQDHLPRIIAFFLGKKGQFSQ